MFTEVKKSGAAKPLIMQFWERDVGATWLSFERKKIIEFSKIRHREKVSVSGYVKWVSNSVFALLPTLFSNQIYLLCANYTETCPPENSYISVSGETKFERLTPNRQSPSSRTFEARLIINVLEWKNDKPNFELPKYWWNKPDNV